MKNKIAIHCPAKELWDKVQEKALGSGLKWLEGHTATRDYWHFDKAYTCLYLNDRDGTDVLWYGHKDRGEGYTIIPAKEWLAELKVGDSVELLKYGRFGNDSFSLMEQADVGDIGKIVEILPTQHRVKFKEGNIYFNFDIKDVSEYLKLIESEDSMKERDIDINYTKMANSKAYSVPLREGDNVRVVDGSNSEYVTTGDVCEITEVDKHSYAYPFLIKSCDGKQTWGIKATDLELIPTEKDIVVGSVWESPIGDKITLMSFEENGNPKFNDGTVRRMNMFLIHFKLIHRGDEEMVETERYCEKHYNQRVIASGSTEPNKQNKKEKKMKRAGKVIKVGMLVVDRECDNSGKIDVIYPESGQAIYIDQKDGSIHLVSIDRLYIPVIMPKPVAKKKKK